MVFADKVLAQPLCYEFPILDFNFKIINGINKLGIFFFVR